MAGWPAAMLALALLLAAAPAAQGPGPGGAAAGGPETANCTAVVACTFGCVQGQTLWVHIPAAGGGAASCGGATAVCAQLASPSSPCYTEAGPVLYSSAYGACALASAAVPPGSCGAK